MKVKYTQIGVQLGVSYNKLQEFKKEDFPLAALLNYCLQGNVEGQPLTWRAIVDALRSDTVEEAKLAQKIEKKYCGVFKEQTTPKGYSGGKLLTMN